jgi:hypothetical protein
MNVTIKYIVCPVNDRFQGRTYQVQLFYPELRPDYHPGAPSQPTPKYETRVVKDFVVLEDAIQLCRQMNEMLTSK